MTIRKQIGLASVGLALALASSCWSEEAGADRPAEEVTCRDVGNMHSFTLNERQRIKAIHYLRVALEGKAVVQDHGMGYGPSIQLIVKDPDGTSRVFTVWRSVFVQSDGKIFPFPFGLTVEDWWEVAYDARK